MQSHEAIRIELTNEWHARPRLQLPVLFRCTHVLELSGDGGVAASRDSFAQLCDEFSQPPPSSDARFHSVEVGTCLVKWEGHTECTTHTVIVPGNSAPLFGESALDLLHAPKRKALLRQMFIGVQIEVIRPPEDDPTGFGVAKASLGSEEIYGGWMSARTAVVWSSFKLDAKGFIRIVVIANEGHEARLSRLVQRLLDLESYRMLAMLGLPRAREVMASLSAIEPELDDVMRRLADDRESVDEPESLDRIINVAAKVEHVAAETIYRFAASQAYARIVERRSSEVDEEVLDDHQRYTQFLSRSLQPAMRTCDAAGRRIEHLAQRVARAASMLDTMVDVSQTDQNQRILASLADSSRLQLKLQQAVESFSIVAISYYGVGLLSYVLKSLKAGGLPVDAQLLTGLAAPAVLASVWYSIRQVRKQLHRDGDATLRE